MGELRTLTQADSPELRRVLRLRPIDNIFIISRLLRAGVAAFGNPLLGWIENGSIASVLSDGYTLTPINAVDEALDAFARYEEHRHAISIMGARQECIGLWERLCQRSYGQWANPREVRDHQQVMVIDSDPKVEADPRVVALGTRYLDQYFFAAQAMYTEEVGVAPIDLSSYRAHVADLMMRGMAFGMVLGARVVFKADVVADADGIVQVGGVWLAPDLRGRGMSEACMAAVVDQIRTRWNTVTLYVNSYNTRAIACYEGVGFHLFSECATILY